jgi:hypothetical protein
MKKVLKILFPILYIFESIIVEVDEEVYGVSCRNFELSQNDDEYKIFIQNLR